MALAVTFRVSYPYIRAEITQIFSHSLTAEEVRPPSLLMKVDNVCPIPCFPGYWRVVGRMIVI